MVLETLAEVAPSTADKGRLASRACRSIKARCRFRSILARIAAESSGWGLCCSPEPAASSPPSSDGSMLLSQTSSTTEERQLWKPKQALLSRSNSGLPRSKSYMLPVFSSSTVILERFSHTNATLSFGMRLDLIPLIQRHMNCSGQLNKRYQSTYLRYQSQCRFSFSLLALLMI